LDDIYILELGKIMHKCHSGNLPDNFNRLFIPVNQVRCPTTRSATRDVCGKRSLKHPDSRP